jgi:hypothetical protein
MRKGAHDAFLSRGCFRPRAWVLRLPLETWGPKILMGPTGAAVHTPGGGLPNISGYFDRDTVDGEDCAFGVGGDLGASDAPRQRVKWSAVGSR